MSKPRAAAARRFALLWALAAATLLLCSKSSPLYPINDWTDANIYFSVGKGMLRGLMPYRDLYDHKGPLLYAAHALCAWVSPLGFAGVYVLETLCAAAFLAVADRLMALYGARRYRLPALMLLAFAVYASYSFQQGDSAEELCLPLLLYALYDLLRHLKTDGGAPMPARRVLLHGALFGCVFWVKFTLCGLHAAFLLTLLIEAASGKSGRRFLACLGWYALGFALATLPWLVYFGLNGAILPWLKTYLYDNLFLYSGSEAGGGLWARAKEMGKSGLYWLGQNLLYTAPLALGLVWGALRRGAARLERLALALAAGLAVLGVFVGGKSYPYYGLALAAFAPLGFAAVCARLCRRFPEGLAPRLPKAAQAALWAVGCAAWLAACGLVSPNPRQSLLQPRERTMQYQFAAVVERYESPTLLNYGFMDAGFYTACGLTPTVKYFHQTNVPLQEMLDEQERYVRDGACGFVVTRGKQPSCIGDRYDLIATADAPDGYWYEHVYLYKRRDIAEKAP